MVPSSSATSTSTVGLPRESRISRAPTASMLATASPALVEGVRAEATRWAAAPRRPDPRHTSLSGQALVGHRERCSETRVVPNQGDVGLQAATAGEFDYPAE